MGAMNAQKSKSGTVWRCILLATVVLAGLSLPAVLALSRVAAPLSVLLEAVVATAGLSFLVFGLFGLSRQRFGIWWLFLALGRLMVIRLIHYGVVDFSGFGFTDEFFLHLGMESTRVAIMEYDRELMVGGLLLIMVWGAMRPLAQVALLQRKGSLAVLCLVGLGVAAMGRSALPEWRLVKAYSDWRHPLAILV